MSDQKKQDAAAAAALQQIIATATQLGISGDSYLEDLPPTLRAMLETYVSGYDSGSRPEALARTWEMVGQTVKENSVTTATTKAAKSGGAITPGEQKQLDKAVADGEVTGGETILPDSPPWIYDQFGAEPTFAQRQRISEEWNTVFGTKYTYDQLVQLPQFNDPTETTQKVVQAAQLDIEPQVEYSVTLPGNRTYKITGDQQKTQFGLYGYDNKDVVKLVRWADTFNLKDSTGATAWQPLAALVKAKKLDLSVPLLLQDPNIDSDTGKVLHKPEGTRPGLGTGKREVGKGPHRKIVDIEPFQQNRFAVQNEMSIAQLTNDYKQNLKKYGDPTMAYLGTLDASLAARLMASGGDTTKVTNEDSLLTQQYLLNGQWSSDGMAAMGYAGGSGLDAFLQRLAPEKGGSIRMKADPEALKQGVKDLWRSMFRGDPSEATVMQMVGELQAQQAAAPEDQTIDMNARLRSLIEGKPEYQTLYGQKQAGQTEADYQGQFLAASQDLIGNEAADNGAVLAGMRTGDYQTTVGATAGSSRAWNNSRFLGRLATAAQMVNERT